MVKKQSNPFPPVVPSKPSPPPPPPPKKECVEISTEVYVYQEPETILLKIASGGPLPGPAALIDTLMAVCAKPTAENIATALHIASRAEIKLDHSREVRRKLKI